jgi:hypothetical protein
MGGCVDKSGTQSCHLRHFYVTLDGDSRQKTERAVGGPLA